MDFYRLHYSPKRKPESPLRSGKKIRSNSVLTILQPVIDEDNINSIIYRPKGSLKTKIARKYAKSIAEYSREKNVKGEKDP
jgi:hypothetical protein